MKVKTWIIQAWKQVVESIFKRLTALFTKCEKRPYKF